MSSSPSSSSPRGASPSRAGMRSRRSACCRATRPLVSSSLAPMLPAATCRARSGQPDVRRRQRRPRRRSRSSETCSAAPVAEPKRAVSERRSRVIDRLLAASGVQVDLESAIYRADNLIAPSQTVALARRARADSAVDLRRRRRSVGARPRGSLLRGAPAREASPPTGHAGRSPVLPPRVRGGLRGRSSQGCATGTGGRSTPIARSPCAGHPSPKRRFCPAERPARRVSSAAVTHPRVWLVVSPVVAAGVLGAHSLAYRITSTPSDPFHAYLGHAPQILLLLAIVGIVVGALGAPRQSASAARFPRGRARDVRPPGASRASPAWRRGCSRHVARVSRRARSPDPGRVPGVDARPVGASRGATSSASQSGSVHGCSSGSSRSSSIMSPRCGVRARRPGGRRLCSCPADPRASR